MKNFIKHWVILVFVITGSAVRYIDKIPFIVPLKGVVTADSAEEAIETAIKVFDAMKFESYQITGIKQVGDR